jgi:hypothetical protein
MIFETLNSIYKVEKLADNTFKITKIEVLSPSSFNAVGVPRISSYAKVTVGDRAYFEGWATSRVVNIKEDVPVA